MICAIRLFLPTGDRRAFTSRREESEPGEFGPFSNLGKLENGVSREIRPTWVPKLVA